MGGGGEDYVRINFFSFYWTMSCSIFYLSCKHGNSCNKLHRVSQIFFFFQDCSPPHKSFLTWLSLTTWGGSQAFFPLKCTVILPHRGKESSFLKVYPSLASPQNAMLPFPTNPLPSICIQGFFPLQNAKSTQNASLQILIFPAIYIYLLFFFSFFFYYYFLWICFSFFFSPKTWNSSPKWKNYSPLFGANNRRIDTPGHWPTALLPVPLPTLYPHHNMMPLALPCTI